MSSTDTSAPSVNPPARTRRVVSQRWMIAAAALSAVAVVAWLPGAWPAALAGFVFSLASAMLSRGGVREIKVSESQRRRQAQLWPDGATKAVVEAMREPAFLIDRNLLLRYRNSGSEAIFGSMALGDAISLRFRSPELLAVIETSVAQGTRGSTTYSEGRATDRLWAVDVLPIPPAHGERPAFFLILMRDRTGERRIEQMRTDFVANASHELRTPLASLIGFIETLQGPARDDAQARARFLDIMGDQAARMSRLIDDLLSLSRIEMKRHVALEGSVDLAEVLGEVGEAMAPLAADCNVIVETAFDEGPLLVAGDRDELVQVFANLVENACKYGEDGQRVVISLKRASERASAMIDASVQDFGPGIPPEHVPRLTERFYRVDTGTSRAKRGTGLGLSIVRNILLRHRARLIVTSTVGAGSTFTARFPASAES